MNSQEEYPSPNIFLKKYFIYLFLERGGGRETSMWLIPQCMHVPWLGIELANLCFAGRCPTNWTTLVSMSSPIILWFGPRVALLEHFLWLYWLFLFSGFCCSFVTEESISLLGNRHQQWGKRIPWLSLPSRLDHSSVPRTLSPTGPSPWSATVVGTPGSPNCCHSS